MQLNHHIFRANDIRGVAFKDLTEELVLDLGKALGSEALNRGVEEFIIGRDARLSSTAIFECCKYSNIAICQRCNTQILEC